MPLALETGMQFKTRFRILPLLLPATVLLPIACSESEPSPGATGDGDGAMSGGMGGTDGATGGASGGAFVVSPAGGAPSGGAPVVLPNPLLEGCTSNLGGMGGMSSMGSADENLVIDDFEDQDDVVWTNGISGHWESHNDLSEGGEQSPLGGRHEPDSDWVDAVGENETFAPGRDGGYSAHFTGKGFEIWGSGQALYFAVDETGDECIYDATAFDGITFWAKGSIQLSYPDDPAKLPKEIEENKLKVHVVERDVVPNEIGGGCNQEKEDCWDSHRTRVDLKDCWQKYVLPFEDLERDRWSKLNPGELDLDKLYQLVFEVSGYQEYEIWLDDLEFFVGEAPQAVTCDE